MAAPGEQVTRRRSNRIAQQPEKASSSSARGGRSCEKRKLDSASVNGGDSSSPPKETKSGGCTVDDGDETAAPTVTETLQEFNKNYLHFVQEEEKRCGKNKAPKGSKSKRSKAPQGSKSKREEDNKEDDDAKRGSKRPDLKIITKMREMKTCINSENRIIGSIPGLEVGHQFFSRAEMVVVGCHGHWLNGIDYIGQGKKPKDINCELPVATAIVVSGQYEDDLDNCEEINYTGQGGNNLHGDKRQVKDQEMTRGNLALKNAFDAGIPIRVVRGHKCSNSYVGKVYTYDGLYKVVKHWPEKGVSGFTVFKYKLKRIDGQPPLTTSQVLYTRSRAPNSTSDIRGLVCEDITGGLEDMPIPATNLVDDPPVAPIGFIYRKDMEYSKSVKIPPNASGCQCQGMCNDPKVCACAKLNGFDFPYVLRDGGRLIEPKAIVFECNPNCGCGSGCVNRISQKGMKYRLEVFRTPNREWGVRSWDYIPSGAPICEYIGRLTKTSEIDNVGDNNYFLEIDCLQTMKGMDARERRLGDVSLPSSLVDVDNAPEFCIDGGSTGNVTRYINHSCEPNLFVQCILSSHHDPKLARIVTSLH